MSTIKTRLDQIKSRFTRKTLLIIGATVGVIAAGVIAYDQPDEFVLEDGETEDGAAEDLSGIPEEPTD